MTTLTVKINVTEKYTHPIYGRIFEGCVSSCANIFGEDAAVCARTLAQIEEWVARIEARVAQFTRLNDGGSVISTEVVRS